MNVGVQISFQASAWLRFKVQTSLVAYFITTLLKKKWSFSESEQIEINTVDAAERHSFGEV